MPPCYAKPITSRAVVGVPMYTKVGTKNIQEVLEVFSKPSRQWLCKYLLGFSVKAYPLKGTCSHLSSHKDKKQVLKSLAFPLRKMRPLRFGT